MSRQPENFWRQQSGAAALEFALVLPLLLTLFLGQFELVSAIRANIKVQSAAQTLAELVAKQVTVNATTIADYCAGAKLVLAPLASATLKATVVSVTNNSGAKAVDWQDTTCGNAVSLANAVALASGAVANAGDSVILVQTSYVYNSPVGYLLSVPLTMTQTALYRPRSNATIIHG
jgi:Flp pilus assembly protein TadG